MRNDLTVIFCVGPWNGVQYSGIPQLTNYSPYTFNFVSNEKKGCGICKIHQSPKCECMKGFRPKLQRKWDEED